VLPQTKAILWGGIEDNNGKDYNFACSFSDYTSVTKYKETAMIVLGDEPLMTGIIQKDKHLVLIVRWYYAERESDVIHLIEQTDFNHLHNRLTHKQIFLESANYVLFESVERFENVSEYLTFTIESGEYSIDTYEIKNETTAVLVDRVMITTHPLSVVSSSPHRN
jgi:hypothetical protein